MGTLQKAQDVVTMSACFVFLNRREKCVLCWRTHEAFAVRGMSSNMHTARPSTKRNMKSSYKATPMNMESQGDHVTGSPIQKRRSRLPRVLLLAG
jgi:hypothetical protein